MIRLIDNFTLFAYCALIFWLSSQESVPVPPLFPHVDKLIHSSAYLLMSVLAWRCFRHYIKTPNIVAIVSIIFCSLYGLSDEWHQSFVAGRFADINDWLADTIGAFIGVLMMAIYQKQRSVRKAKVK